MVYQKNIETRNRILNAAKELFYEFGYEKTTIREICKRAQLQNQSSYYYYFEDKLDIVKGITDDFIKAVMDFDSQFIHEEDVLVHFFVVQKIILSKIVLNVRNSIYFYEFEKYTTFSFFVKTADKRYINLFREVWELINPHLDFQGEDSKFIRSSYNTTLGKTIYNINTQNLEMSREAVVKKMIYFYPFFAGFSSEKLDEAYEKAMTAYEKLAKRELDDIIFLI